MKNVVVLAGIFSCLILTYANEHATPETPSRVLLLPFTVDAAVEDPWEGLAPVLALQTRVTNPERLIPFTACRRKLNQYGMSIVVPVSLATRVKLAADLEADLLVSGHLEQDRLVLQLYYTGNQQLERMVLEKKGDAQYPDQIAGLIGLPFDAPSTRQYDLFRVWASIYYLEEPENARTTVDKLLEHDLTGWLFVQEYLDLFGDPGSNLSNAADLAYWRDFFLKKQHYARAANLSQRTMELRHNPRDLIAHARILLAVGDQDQACDYLKKAESFGFTDQALQAHLRDCAKRLSEDTTKTN